MCIRDRGGTVDAGATGEYGGTTVSVQDPGVLLTGSPTEQSVWMSHGVDGATQRMRHRLEAVADAQHGYAGLEQRPVDRRRTRHVDAVSYTHLTLPTILRV